MSTETTTTRTRTSMFMGTIVITDDIHNIEVDTRGAGPEQVAIRFTLPDFNALPNIYLSMASAIRLRDLLTAALDTSVTA